MIILILLAIQRVVSLTPSITEIIYAIEAQDKLVGVVAECDYPPNINLPIVGNYVVPNIEKIVSLSPNIVFVGAGVQKPLWNKLKAVNLNIYVIEPENLSEIYDAILKIGKLLGKEENAKSLVINMKKELDKITKIKPQKKKKVFVEIQDNPLITCGKNSFINDIINLADAINIVDIDNPYPVVSTEFVIKKDPDVILVLHKVKKEEIKKRVAWQNISAIKNNMLIDDIDENLLVRPGPRIIEGIKILKQKIYPELFKN